MSARKRETEYLTEDKLPSYLRLIFPGVSDWVHDKGLRDARGKCVRTAQGSYARPDYCSETLRIIIEFDGYQHYTRAANVLLDAEKDALYQKMGYRVVRIPYFVQMSSETVRSLFGVRVHIPQTYPHGFIDAKCVLPCDFCELGVQRFLRDLERFSPLRSAILQSLKDRLCPDGGETAWNKIFPLSLRAQIQ